MSASILYIETSTEVCSVALAHGDRLADLIESREKNSHAAYLALYIDTILKRNSLTVPELSAIGVSVGPGSYTGLRIGVSTAKGLAYGAGIPVLGISALESMALKAATLYSASLPPGTLYCPALDARRMEVYCAVYDAQNGIHQAVNALIINTETFEPLLSRQHVLFFGSGAEKIRQTIVSPNAHFVDDFYPSAADMIPVGARKYSDKAFEDVAYFEPFYLKDFVATTPKNKLSGEGDSARK